MPNVRNHRSHWYIHVNHYKIVTVVSQVTTVALVHITSQQLKLDPSSVNVTLRSLDILTDDHRAFVAAGGDVSKVKEFNNALYEPFFDICIEQVLNYPYRLQIHARYIIYEHVLGVNARSPH